VYDKRIKIFIILSALLLLACVLRLTQMQLLPGSAVQEHIAELKRQMSFSRQFKTIRGRILDRKGRVLAVDEPRFYLHINYQLCCFWDERIRQAKRLKEINKSRSTPANPSLSKLRQMIQERLEDVNEIIDKCTYFGLPRSDIEAKIKQINDKTWNLRTFLAWRRNNPDPKIIAKFGGKISSVPLSVALKDFKDKFPDKNQRLLLIEKIDDIPQINKSYPLLELKTEDDIFAAQVEFSDTEGVEIQPTAQRFYPYGCVAAHTIGWVGPATQPKDIKLFANDRLARYLQDDVCGREDGVEYVCEAILRGRRGEEIYDIDRQLISRTETRFGSDVFLTLDIELQQRIEEYLGSYNHDPNCGPGMAAVVLEVETGDILALVSLPAFDLNHIRQQYSALVNDPDQPLINRAINKQYPPGSVVKPLILIAGLQSGKITADEIISCPAQKAPEGWPSCWIYNRHPWMGHDNQWQNYARNAIKGSCNIYFSRLAERIEAPVLQNWLFKFGYGHKIPLTTGLTGNSSGISDTAQAIRDLRQAQGQISSVRPKNPITNVEQVPDLNKGERRFFGIGQGNLRVTPLQAANAFAAIARGGRYKTARLFIEPEAAKGQRRETSTDLNISTETLAVIYDGMNAVVNESGGTAYKEFEHSGLSEQGIKVYGKTGSTEEPDNAWFGGFARDPAGRCIAIAVVVEGGQHGSRDAAPLARDIIQFCIEAGYLQANTDLR